MKNDACGRLAASGGILERLGNVLLEPSGRVLGRPEGLWGGFWEVLGGFLDVLTSSGARLGASWAVSWAS